jgi:hypothetical protein
VEQAKEKRQTHIIAEVIEKVLVNETKFKEKTNTKNDIFGKYKDKFTKD